MAYNLAEVLEQHVETVQSKKEQELGLYVSNQLAQDYARLSPAIYELKRELVVVPENENEVLARFNLDVSGKEVSHKGPKTYLTIPLIIQTEYDQKTKKIDCEGITTVEYEMNYHEILPDQRQNKESWQRSRNQLSVYGDEGNFNASCQYGTQTIAVSVKGKWTYQGKVESVTVKIPSIPEKAMNLAAQAQLRYFQILTEAKQQGYFPGQTLSQPELRFLWIPRSEDFEVKVEEMEIVKPDPALILRVDKKHDHVISLWHTETEEPLEFLVRRHTK